MEKELLAIDYNRDPTCPYLMEDFMHVVDIRMFNSMNRGMGKSHMEVFSKGKHTDLEDQSKNKIIKLLPYSENIRQRSGRKSKHLHTTESNSRRSKRMKNNSEKKSETSTKTTDRLSFLNTPLKRKSHSKRSLQKNNLSAKKFPSSSKFEMIEAECTTNCQATLITLKLSKAEEIALHYRAEKYINGIKPDPRFYDIEEGKRLNLFSEANSKQVYENISDNSRRSKKRKSYDNMECFVTHRNALEDIPLPEGTKLSKPSTKLVELVARAVYESPDGILQVQQVYDSLQHRYPYFRFMHKTAISSWKSSIRHALFQKWFYKIYIINGSNSDGKGCYWALNTSCTPKEWNMPGQVNSKLIQLQMTAITTPTKCEKPVLQQSIKIREQSNDRDPDPLLPSAVFHKPKLRYDTRDKGGDYMASNGEINSDLQAFFPLSPSSEYPGDLGYPISLVSCNIEYWDDNPVLICPGYRSIECCSSTMLEHVEGHCVWFDGNYYDILD